MSRTQTVKPVKCYCLAEKPAIKRCQEECRGRVQTSMKTTESFWKRVEPTEHNQFRRCCDFDFVTWILPPNGANEKRSRLLMVHCCCCSCLAWCSVRSSSSFPSMFKPPTRTHGDKRNQKLTSIPVRWGRGGGAGVRKPDPAVNMKRFTNLY